MRKRMNVFKQVLRCTLIGIGLIQLFSFKTEDAVKVSAQGNYSFQRINLPEFEDCTAEEVIQIVEEEFEENDTSILEELYIQYDTYYD